MKDFSRVGKRLSLSRSISSLGSLRGSMQSTRLFLRKQLWIWPLIAAGILGLLGYWIRVRVEGAMQDNLAAELQTILNAEVESLRIWARDEEATARTQAADPEVRLLSEKLLALAARPETAPAALAAAEAARRLAARLAPCLEDHSYAGYIVSSLEGKIVAANHAELVGKDLLGRLSGPLAAVRAGKSALTLPYPSKVLLEDQEGELRSGVPTMFVLAPLRDATGKVLGALGLRIRPEADFTRILNVARLGSTGETYAFDREGRFLSMSRFDDELKRIGLLVDRKEIRSILNIEVRDPGVDLRSGVRPIQSRSEQPLTRMAAAATAGSDGVDVAGYRDYRGVPVVGAWKWLPDFDMGVATEVDVAEAYQPLFLLRATFWGLFALLAIAALAIFLFTVVTARLQVKIRRAAIEARRLGQYQLEERLGEGGMGVVYRGRHALLRRPTAIKLLDADKTNDDAIARFEREVTLTSQLNHPNTIAIYDYGRTPEGVFYYAMELLDGVDLERLVRDHGPQPPGRVIDILRQICGSLAEAHGVGLIHRDVKPSNVVLTRRGGLFDFVKLLDFGLVKAVAAGKQASLTSAGSLTGTPMYMSPEAIEAPDTADARSDLYAVGAVGYYLLTGTAVFDGASVVEIIRKQISAPPPRPSERLGSKLSADLEELILACLAKRPEDRPASAARLKTLLASCKDAGAWTEADAEAWWARVFVPGQAATPSSPTQNVADGRTVLWSPK